MNYLVIDLEMCKVPKYLRREYRYALETIQIGAVLLDENFERIGTLSQYVRPEYGFIDDFIEHFTGINRNMVEHAPTMGEALRHLVDWIGDREYKVYAWSDSDYLQIFHEVFEKEIEDERVYGFMDESRWIDYQKVVGDRYGFDRAVGLEEILNRAEIFPQGRYHDGLDDAINTSLLIKKLEQNEDYCLIGYEPEGKEKEILGYNLGELFAGLEIMTA